MPQSRQEKKIQMELKEQGKQREFTRDEIKFGIAEQQQRSGSGSTIPGSMLIGTGQGQALPHTPSFFKNNVATRFAQGRKEKALQKEEIKQAKETIDTQEKIFFYGQKTQTENPGKLR